MYGKKELEYISYNRRENTKTTSEIYSWWNNGVMCALRTDETVIVLESEYSDSDITS